VTEAQNPILRAVSLGHLFADGNWAFRGIDFQLEAGEISVLSGRNGAGKTIFAKHLAGLLQPSEGRVLVLGEDMHSIKTNKATLVGYIFQDARLQCVGETVFDDILFGPRNLGLPAEEAIARAESALLASGLSDRRDSFVHTLSGGELRRLAIAGVLALEPKAAILDEPFANLDPEGVRSVLKIIHETADRGMALLVVTHELEKVLGLARSFSVMDKGAIALTGSPEEVLERGIEPYGLRDPRRTPSGIKDLQWLE
jgi:biotin transport system ATP-binding protein